MKQLELTNIYQKIRSKVIGRDKELKIILAALQTSRNVMLVGAPGTSKSTILRHITGAIDVPLYVVEGSADLTPGKLIGTHNPSKVMSEGYSVDAFDRGSLVDAMLSGGFLYVEEFNRMPDDAMNTLLRAIDERRIAIPRIGEIIAAPSFRLIGAMNPFDDVGTERLSRAISDRLCLVELEYQSLDEELRIVRQETGTTDSQVTQLAVRLVRKTRKHPELQMGSSVRGAIDFVLIAEERLRSEGVEGLQNFWSPAGRHACEILLEIAIVALSARIWISDASTKKPAEIIREIWNELLGTEVPGLVEGRMDFSDTNPEGEPGGSSNVRPRASHSLPPDTKTSAKNSNPPEDPKASDRKPASVCAAQRAFLGDSEWRDLTVGGSDLPKVLRDALNKGQNTEDREEAKKLARRIAVSVPRNRGLSANKRGKLQSILYSERASELDVDRTLEKIVAHGLVASNDFVVRDRSDQPRAFVLILDASGSMRGEGIIQALVMLAAFTTTVLHSDYSIVVFGDRATTLKPIRRSARLGHLFDQMFKIRTDGMTDIASGLQTGLQELYKSRATKRTGIILTDGAHNAHSDPFAVALRYPQLHVVAIKTPTVAAERTCTELARLGKGRYTRINELQEIPTRLRSLLF